MQCGAEGLLEEKGGVGGGRGEAPEEGVEPAELADAVGTVAPAELPVLPAGPTQLLRVAPV